MKPKSDEAELFETSIGKVQVQVYFDEYNEECLEVDTVETDENAKNGPSGTVYFGHSDGELTVEHSSLWSTGEPMPDPVEKEWSYYEGGPTWKRGRLPGPLMKEFVAIAEEWFRNHPDAFEKEARQEYRLAFSDTIRELEDSARALRSKADIRAKESRAPYMRGNAGAAKALHHTAKLMRDLARQLLAEKKRLARYRRPEAA